MLDAARAVFAERGYHGAGTAEIAAHCGCSEPLLYRHFASKQALFAAVLLDSALLLRERIAPFFATTGDPLTTLVTVAEVASRDDLFLEVSRLRMLAVTLVDEPEIRAALTHLVEDMHAHITGLMARARDLGTLRAGVDPGEAAWLWYGIALQSGVRRTLFGPGEAGQASRTGAALIALLTAEENHP